MINLDESVLVNDLRQTICKDVSISMKGTGRYQVLAPFKFEDGDWFVVYLIKESNGWTISDEGHTLMHLSYWLDTQQVTGGDTERANIFSSITKMYKLELTDGAITMPVEEDRNIGGNILSYLQALTKITDISFLTKERVKRAFLDDLIEFMKETYKERAIPQWSNPVWDREGAYAVDVRLDISKVPFFLYAVWNTNRALNTVISILKYREWEKQKQFRAIVVHEYMEDLPHTVLKKVTDAADKQVSAFFDKKEEIKMYLADEAKLLGPS